MKTWRASMAVPVDCIVRLSAQQGTQAQCINVVTDPDMEVPWDVVSYLNSAVPNVTPPMRRSVVEEVIKIKDWLGVWFDGGKPRFLQRDL
jgi:hypothetical protein